MIHRIYIIQPFKLQERRVGDFTFRNYMTNATCKAHRRDYEQAEEY